ncbi:hypothetical protein BCV72DRAFT_331923 [Rhizopus microsporus var. microsporus]|uniref:Cofilin n=2 Tax=Rhizopus microsporus TaxID=58291 RepID=A0A2G4T8R5_RHIZD|nr:uncharacterized protein RHIMIDRAFT_288316 [Rhizopus microsporus ATCC 52813]ORE11922.1 hypothetical protein BCV72DRAFT_331923 [Rhizopus microsporus var. microsporus]PHZ17415.1 hypothetical protein RHIMIDRAFT_288316 [Rhizopus microsporus ATCC 52813]
MASSGVSTDNECLVKYNELKLRKTFKYIIYKLSDDNKQIVVEKAVESGSYDDFLNDLPENVPRYAVYDFDYVKTDEGQRNKITFFSWSPDSSRVRDKMLYASSKDSLRRQLQGIAVEIQGTDSSEVAYESVLEKAQRSS